MNRKDSLSLVFGTRQREVNADRITFPKEFNRHKQKYQGKYYQQRKLQRGAQVGGEGTNNARI